MTLTLPIQVGRKYVRRDGTAVTAGPSGNGTVGVGDGKAVFSDTGRANYDNGPDHPHDLVADLQSDQGHPHAALMALYAQDAAETAEPWKRWEFSGSCTSPEWINCTKHPEWLDRYGYRRKPKTITINGRDVPEPFRGTLYGSQRYWIARLGEEHSPVCECTNYTPETGERHVAAGLVHLTREAAELHANALLSFTKAPS